MARKGTNTRSSNRTLAKTEWRIVTESHADFFLFFFKVESNLDGKDGEGR